jgi:sugar/nucleoside kinase (ribokinase family)
VTALGRHPLARAAHDDLRARGVAVRDATPEASAPPPVSTVRVIDGSGERSVSSVNDTGAPGATVESVDVRGVLVLDGWYAGLALPAVRAARAAEVPVLLGAGSWRPLVAELLPLADYAIVPASFPAERIPAQVVCALTNGAEPIVWRAPDAAGQITPPAVAARDTLAAGDVFLGAAAHALATGAREWPAVLTAAAEVAARFVAQVGRAGL